MFRLAVPLLLVLACVLTGCNGDSETDATAADIGEGTTAPQSPDSDDRSDPPDEGAAPEDEGATPDEEGAESTPTEPSVPEVGQTVTTASFCHGIHQVLVAENGEQRGSEAMRLLSDGLPKDMPEQARAGLQVLVDLSPYFEDLEKLFRSYYALGEADKQSVHAFAGYVTTECGPTLVKELLPALPSDLVAELPSELATLLPKS